ncbi:MAG: hypothetical protein P1R58_04570 [bacterium]|nr:hypothetical protein [bacterium]
MKSNVHKILILLLLGTALSVTVYGKDRPVASPVDLIESDYRAGRIDLDTKVLLQIQTIKTPDKLPQRYMSASGDVIRYTDRSATLILLEIRRVWDQLSPEVQLAASEVIQRLPAEFFYNSPGGFFKLHYNDTGVNAVPLADDNANTIPDFVENCAAYLDTAYEKHVALGYADPPSDGTEGGDSLYDIYFENIGFYGYVVNETQGPETWDDFITFMVMHNDFVGFPPNSDPESQVAGSAKATAAHEFHHSVQLGYDATIDLWFLESDATHMEDIVYDHVDDNYNYLLSFFDWPQTALTENTSPHYYSSFVWEMFLIEKFDTSLIRALWEGARFNPFPKVMNDTLLGRYGWTLDSAFSEFVNWNYCTGNRADALHYSEGASYPPVWVDRTHSIYPVGLQAGPASPAGYGSCYVSFFPGTAAGTLHLTFNGDDARDWSAWLIKSTADNVHTFEQITLDAINESGSIDIPEFQNYYRIALAAANISENTATAPFFYSASVSVPYGVSTSWLEVDSAVYSGGLRKFEVLATNDAPVADILSLTAWDDLGWIVADTVSESLLPGEDTVFTFSVTPPQGTPLGTLSNMQYKVWSWGDTSQNVVGDAVGMTELQRGDVDFSGAVDISDLTSFVDYLFAGGPLPQPVEESADVDCSFDVNITDLTTFVEYLFQAGPAAPCNPY